MKTAIQELIEELKANDVSHGMYWIKQPNEFFEKYIKKERDQTNKAYYQAIYDKNQGQIKDEYYNQTYNQNK
jgi:S-adenosylmethionine:tRNA-ribosyltransferase-isomerase (queuine synthetase)